MTTTAGHQIARDNLLRMAPFTLERSGEDAQEADGLTLEGHAAVFDRWTLIDSWEGRFSERVAPGAFKKTFREMRPVLQFDHGRHPMVGSIPLGRFIDGTPKEDDLGAFVRARLHDNWLIQPVRDAIESESIGGMSFRFEVVREEWREEPDGKLIRDDEQLLMMLWDPTTDGPYRTMKELRVPELGPVVFPAYTDTDVSVRSAVEKGRTVIDLGALARNESERSSLARTLFMAERATLGHKDPVAGTPDDAPPAAEETRDTPETAPPVQAEVNPPGAERTVADLAEQMRERLKSLGRS